MSQSAATVASDRPGSIEWSFAARRLASGQNTVEVAALFRVAAAEIESLCEDPAFQTLVESYRQQKAKSPEQRAEERRELIADGLDCLLENRHVRAILWGAGRLGLVGAPGKDEAAKRLKAYDPLEGIKFGPWDDVYGASPRDFQDACRDYDPDYFLNAERVAESAGGAKDPADITASSRRAAAKPAPEREPVMSTPVMSTEPCQDTEAEAEPVPAAPTRVAAPWLAVTQAPEKTPLSPEGAVSDAKPQAGTSANIKATIPSQPTPKKGRTATGSKPVGPQTDQPKPEAAPANTNQSRPASTHWRREPLPRHYRARAP